MPNKKGGKNYKKSKHADDEPILYERHEGQMYGRIVKLLGNCNVLVFCNDNKERICHIRGSMRKKVWLGPGDIVLISLRDTEDRGDVCARYDPRVIHRLQARDKTINERLFAAIEKCDTLTAKMVHLGINDDGFEFEAGNNEVVDDESSASDSDSSDDGGMRPSNRAAQKKAMMFDTDYVEEEAGEVDIDNI
jgi:translation initiation factor 1A